MPYNLSIVEQIELWQKRKGKSTEDMASLLGVSPQNYLRRKRLNSFSSAEIEKIAKYLEFTIEFVSK